MTTPAGSLKRYVHTRGLVIGHLIVIVLFGCGGVGVRHEENNIDHKQADILLQQLRFSNDTLKTVKGIGHFRLDSGATSRSARIAWAGTRSGAIRLEIIGLTGKPEYTVAADGQSVFFISYHPYKYHKQKAESIDLADLLSISISSADVADILAGRIPAADYVSVSLEKDHLGGEEKLVLKSWLDKTSQKIYLDKGRKPFAAFEAYEFNGDLRYRVVYEKTRTVEGFELPVKLSIENLKGDRIDVTIERCYPNADLPISVFSPAPA